MKQSYIIGSETSNPEIIYISDFTYDYLNKKIEIWRKDIEYFKSINLNLLFYMDKSPINKSLEIGETQLSNFDRINDIIDEYEQKIEDSYKIIKKIENYYY